MTKMGRAVVAAGIWMTFVQFAQNQLLFLGIWTDHFDGLGLRFETKPVNGMLWTVWCLIHAYLIAVLLRVLPLIRTVVVAWLVGFVMMWCTLYNLQVLPLQLLLAAVPISFAGTYVSARIVQRILHT